MSGCFSSRIECSLVDCDIQIGFFRQQGQRRHAVKEVMLIVVQCGTLRRNDGPWHRLGGFGNIMSFVQIQRGVGKEWRRVIVVAAVMTAIRVV